MTAVDDPDVPQAEQVVRPLEQLSRRDVASAGGKGANLGELASGGFPVPPGFVVCAAAYARFVDEIGLRTAIAERLATVDVGDPVALEQAAEDVRRLIVAEPLPDWLTSAVESAYASLTAAAGTRAVAVRSSATAEDTSTASFAGMNETFLNVSGARNVGEAIRACWASLFGARTVFYRSRRGLPQTDLDIAVVVQAQIVAERAGVMFTVDPASGADDRIVIEGSFGLGEAVVAGRVTPDRYVVAKDDLSILAREVRAKSIAIEAGRDGGTRERRLTAAERAAATLTDGEARAIAELGRRVEEHYGAPQDTEWCIDKAGTLWLLQSRPVTVAGPPPDRGAPESGVVLARGLGASPGRATGPVCVVSSMREATSCLASGDVLVAPMTSPDWVPLMRRASAIVTDSGGMTCHAAIVSRELGIPCIVGAADATRALRDGEVVTVDATRGIVLAGASEPAGAASEPRAPVAPATPSGVVTGTRILVNLSEPSQVERVAALPVDGVGLLRAEMMVLEALEGTHPRLLLRQGRGAEFVQRMADGLRTFAEGFSPRPVTYRTIDFRTNEFRGLEGGDEIEPVEANPMLGYRGALRYQREPDLFRLELEAVLEIWKAGLANLHVMLPFVRTPRELAACRAVIQDVGLLDRPGFELWIMAEVPSVLYHLERYARLGVAGISIGSNDLTQLLLGVDRDSPLLAEAFDERDDAVVTYIQELIAQARTLGLATSICGQAPSVHPQYADLLVRAGIDSISVTPDAVSRTRLLVASAEARLVLACARA